MKKLIPKTSMLRDYTSVAITRQTLKRLETYLERINWEKGPAVDFILTNYLDEVEAQQD